MKKKSTTKKQATGTCYKKKYRLIQKDITECHIKSPKTDKK